MKKKTTKVAKSPKRINVAQKCSQLIDCIEGEFEGIDIPLEEECGGMWSKNHAILSGFYFEPIGFYEDGPYYMLDSDLLKHDVENFLKKYFDVSRLYRGSKDEQPPKSGELVVRLHYGSQELEVYYQNKLRKGRKI